MSEDNKEETWLQSWEELEDSGELDKQLEKIKVFPANNPQDTVPSSRGNPVIILADELRNKLLPPEPAVKILQRPNANGLCKYVNGDVASSAKPKQPLKTLQQREMEYAEARLRILGEARSPLEDQDGPELQQPVDDRLSKIQGRTELPKPQESNAGIIRLPRGPDGTNGFPPRR